MQNENYFSNVIAKKNHIYIYINVFVWLIVWFCTHNRTIAMIKRDGVADYILYYLKKNALPLLPHYFTCTLYPT